MRILWLSPGFAKNEEETSNISPLQDLATELSAMGVEIQIMTINYPYHSKPYTWHGIKIRSGHKFQNRYLRIINWLYCMSYAIKAHREKKFDLIHSFWLGPAWIIGGLLSWFWKTPHLTTLMGQDVLPDNFYLKFVTKKHIPHLVAISKFQKTCFQRSTGLLLEHIIPWGLKKNALDKVIPTERTIDVLGAGGLSEVKNWELWIKTVAEFSKEKLNFNAKIIGYGDHMDRLSSLIATYDADLKISIIPGMPRNDLLQEMAKTKTFLHTSNFESFGLVLLEAYLNGCDIVSTPVGIAEELGLTGTSKEELLNLLERSSIGIAQKPDYIASGMDEIAQRYHHLYEQMSASKISSGKRGLI
ncbi:MAG: glycosyltransferase [Saprospiraceae bacterium]|nr:glycosyltransferase [Saprospiraceae bacterium]